MLEISENKENSQTQLKVIWGVIKGHIKMKKIKKSAKKIKNVVDRKVVLRYNVTRWR